MSRLPPLFPYYGSKWRLAPHYDPPAHRLIVEPFAGSAQYALLHHRHDVLLLDSCPRLGSVWQYLLSASPADVLALPIPGADDHVDAYQWPHPGARELCRAHLASGSGVVGQHNRRSPRMLEHYASGNANAWTPATLRRIAAALPLIRHWRFIAGDYRDAPDVAATWFIDPPYTWMGRHYARSSRRVDFDALACWCRARRGQVIACESEGASWLPFEPLRRERGCQNTQRTEMVWYRPARVQPSMFRHTTEAAR